MSTFITSTCAFIFASYGTNRNNDEVQNVDYRDTPHPVLVWDIGVEQGVLWPASYRFGTGGLSSNHPSKWEQTDTWTGNHRRKLISGVVLDATSTPVSGASVKLFNTSTGAEVDSTTSASDGTYTVGDPNNTTNFVVAVSGSTQGITINTLTGS